MATGQMLANFLTDAKSEKPVAPSRGAFDALVLDAQFRQALTAVRSLGTRGVRVAALETFDGAPTFASRWCRQRYCAPSFEHGTLPYLACLERVLVNAPASVLIPSHDGTVDLMRQHRERLEHHAHVALAKESALAIAVNKQRTLEVAEQLGLGIPRSVTVRGRSDVAAALREIGLPAVVKPVESWVRGEHAGMRLVPQLVTTPGDASGGRGVDEPWGSGAPSAIPDRPAGGRELPVRRRCRLCPLCAVGAAHRTTAGGHIRVAPEHCCATRYR